MNSKPIDPGPETKKMLDQYTISHNPFMFLISLRTGTDVNTYAAIPQDFKIFVNQLRKSVDLFEQQYGLIPDGPGPILSPINLDDVNGPNTGGSQTKNPKNNG